MKILPNFMLISVFLLNLTNFYLQKSLTLAEHLSSIMYRYCFRIGWYQSHVKLMTPYLLGTYFLWPSAHSAKYQTFLLMDKMHKSDKMTWFWDLLTLRLFFFCNEYIYFGNAFKSSHKFYHSNSEFMKNISYIWR